MDSRTLRQAAAAALPRGAFLRRDRGEALFVTDAPRLRPEADWPGIFAKAGFLCRQRDGLLFLAPAASRLAELEAALPDPPDDLCQSLARFAGLAPDAESLRLFALGARMLDGEPDDGRFERRLRRRAAECLRLNAMARHPADADRGVPDPTPTCGGGLYACALLRHIIKEGIAT